MSNSTDPDNIYFNIRINGNGVDISNNNNTVTYGPISQNTPIINDPSKYYVAVTDFSIPGESIPLTIARVLPNQTDPVTRKNDPNKMVAEIGITYKIRNDEGEEEIVFERENLRFIPSTNGTAPEQKAPFQIITPYYYVYSYNNILLSINNALANLWTECEYNEILSTNAPPYFKLTTDDVPKLQLIIPATLFKFKISDVPNQYEKEFLGISCNSALINYLGGFSWTFNEKNDPNFLEYIFRPNIRYPPYDAENRSERISPANQPLFYVNDILSDFFTTAPYQCYSMCDMNGMNNLGNIYQPCEYDYISEVAPDPSSTNVDTRYLNYLVFTQENYLLPQWNCLSKIVIYSQSLPIRNQQSTSRNYSSPDIVDKYPILFSFTPMYETSAQARNYIYYDAREQYKLTDMLGTDPLTKIQLSVGWSDHNGEVFPIYLNPFQSCTIQLGFFKKDLYKSQ